MGSNRFSLFFAFTLAIPAIVYAQLSLDSQNFGKKKGESVSLRDLGYEPDLDIGQSYSFGGSVNTILTHSTSAWDADSVSQKGVEALLQFSKSRNIPRIGLLNIRDPKAPFFKPDEVSTLVNSDAGQHRLKFPNAKTFILGGGHLSTCLCETLRDLIRGVPADPKQTTQLILASDAIFDWPSTWHPIVRSDTRVTLQEVLESPKFTKADFVKALRENIIGAKGKGNFCPMQNWRGSPRLNSNNFRFQIYKGSELLEEWGDKTKPLIKLVFAKTSELGTFVPSAEAQTAELEKSSVVR